MDTFGDHALVCSCKGDRTVRHHELRNRFHEDASTAGMSPEKEKAGLLPARPLEDGIKVEGQERRPADVWLPRGPGGRGEALDFACSSGMRADILAQVVDNPNIVFERYEEFKRSYKNTDQVCEQQGFSFIPMILESHGGSWSSTARNILARVATGQSSAWNEDGEEASLRIAQRMSVALHRENARAVLKRTLAAETVAGFSGWDEVEEQ